MAEKEKSCFIIGPIDKPGTEIHIWAKKALKHIIKPAAEGCGYNNPLRADEITQPGTITRQVIERLIEDDLVIADLSWHNPNVFYELAIRHAVRKPVVQLIREVDSLPFDVINSRTIKYDLQDPDSWVPARDQLVEHIKAVETNPALADNPLTQAIDITLMSRSDDPVEKRMLELIEMMKSLRNSVEESSRTSRGDIRLDYARLRHLGLLDLATDEIPLTATTLADVEHISRPGALYNLAFNAGKKNSDNTEEN